MPNSDLENLYCDVIELNCIVEEKDKQLVKLNGENQRLTDLLRKNETALANQKETNQGFITQEKTLQNQITELRRVVDEKNKHIAELKQEKDKYIALLKSEEDRHINELKYEKDKQITELTKKDKQIAELKSIAKKEEERIAERKTLLIVKTVGITIGSLLALWLIWLIINFVIDVVIPFVKLHWIWILVGLGVVVIGFIIYLIKKAS